MKHDKLLDLDIRDLRLNMIEDLAEMIKALTMDIAFYEDLKPIAKDLQRITNGVTRASKL